MASTYSPLLRFELPASGEQAGLWGNTLDVQIGTLVEQAVAGMTTITLTSAADRTLSTLQGTPDEARSATLLVNGTPGGATNIILPALQKTYHVRNATSQTLTFKTAAQVGGPTVIAGGATLLHCDGVNIYSSIEKLYYSQMNFLSQAGGAFSVPQFDSKGNLSSYGAIAGTWDSGGGAYSVPTNITGFGSFKPVFGNEVGAGARFTSNANVVGSHMCDVVNGVWTGGAGGSMKFVRNGNSTLYMQGDSIFWWGSANGGTAGAAANYALMMYLDTSTGNLITKYQLGISDARLKQDLQPITGALAKVKQLVGYTFAMKDDPGVRRPGLLAQDVQKVLPEAVVTDSEGYMAVAYGHLAGLFVQAINELEQRVTALEARL